MGVVPKFFDSFTNFLAGFGVLGRDKAMSQQYSLTLLSMRELIEAYRGDWLSRKIIDIPAYDMTRQWRTWQAPQEEVELIKNEEKKFQIPQKTMDVLVKSRLFGGAVLIMGVANQGEFNEPMDPEKVKKGDLKWVHVVQRYMLSAGPIIRDITSPWFGQPAYYQRTNIVVPMSTATPIVLPKPEIDIPTGQLLTIHPSRVIRVVGNPYPDIEQATDQWGDSVLQTVHDAIRDASIVSQSITAMVSEAKLDIISIPSLNEILSTTEGARKLTARFSNANVAKSVINALLLDSQEKWERKEIHPEGLPKIGEFFFMVACGAADIPATRVLGKSPDGMNATGDSDTRNYNDRLKSDQETKLTPTMHPLDEVLIRSATGKRDPSTSYIWNTLWQATATEKADIGLKKAQTFQIDATTGLINPEALRIGRQNQLMEDGVYPGLEEALEELKALEVMDLPEEDRFEHSEALKEKMLNPDDPADSDPNKNEPDDSDE